MIDREKVIGHLNDCMEASRQNSTWVFVRKDIVEDALALLKEQKHGYWVFDPNGMDWNLSAWKCSKCHCRNDNIPPNLEKTNPLRWAGSKFCPNCGAKMEKR